MASVHEAMNDSVVTEVTGSGDTGCSYKAHKKNGIVTVWMYGTTNTASSVSSTYGTLPVGWRPGDFVRVVGYTGYSTSMNDSAVFGGINTNGVINLYLPGTANNNTYASTTFIAEN